MNEYAIELGQVVRRERLRQRLTQIELARRTGSTRANISRLESGTGNATVEFAIRAAEALWIRVSIQTTTLSEEAYDENPESAGEL